MRSIPRIAALSPAASPSKRTTILEVNLLINLICSDVRAVPDEETILQDLLPKNVSIQIFKVLLESDAGEQGARMAAMDNATRNAGEMIDSLTLKYNRTRQAFITKELIEIISGAESI